MNTTTTITGLETLTRQCTACRNTLSLVDNFNRCSGNNRSAGWKATCKECESEGKIRTRRKSSFERAIHQRLVSSHQRLLNEALEQKPEVTDLNQLRAMHPDYDDAKLLRLQRLNQKINEANDFLIEEQSSWLDPSMRPSEGIPYNEELFGKPFASDDENSEDIQNQVYNDNH